MFVNTVEKIRITVQRSRVESWAYNETGYQMFSGWSVV